MTYFSSESDAGCSTWPVDFVQTFDSGVEDGYLSLGGIVGKDSANRLIARVDLLDVDCRAVWQAPEVGTMLKTLDTRKIKPIGGVGCLGWFTHCHWISRSREQEKDEERELQTALLIKGTHGETLVKERTDWNHFH